MQIKLNNPPKLAQSKLF